MLQKLDHLYHPPLQDIKQLSVAVRHKANTGHVYAVACVVDGHMPRGAKVKNQM